MTRSRMRSRSTLAASALAVAAAVAFSLAPVASASAAAAAPAKPVPTHPGKPAGLAPHHTDGTLNTDETRVCSGCTPPLVYNGGPVMGTAATTGEDTEYSIYWTGAGSFPTYFPTVVDQYLTDVAADSGKNTNVFSVNTQYSQNPPGGTPTMVYLSHFGGRLTAPDPLPTTNGCPVDPGFTSCLSDAQLQSEISNVISAQGTGVTADMSHMFLLFLPPGVESCDSPGSCSANTFCGYHSTFTLGSAPVIYSNMPYSTTQGCASGQAPNTVATGGDPIPDGEIDTLSHEINESLTDPLPGVSGAWSDSTGHEDGDECSNIYGQPLGSTDPNNANNTQFNQTINGHMYYTQENFSNSSYSANGRGCVQSSGEGNAPPVNAVVVSANPTEIPNDGSSTSTVTVTVTSPAPAQAVPNDEVDFSTFAKSGTCGVINPVKATTDATGHASTTYTASTDNVACTIIATEVAKGGFGQGVVAQGVPSLYTAVAPFRLADTRSGSGEPLAGQSVGAGQSAVVPVSGVDGVPSSATAAVLNVTTTNGTDPSFLSAYPTGSAPPLASNLNFGPGQTVANLVTVPLGTGGRVSIFNHDGTTDVIVDLEGYMQPGNGPGAGLFNPLPPARIADTRGGSGQPNAGQTVTGGTSVVVQVTGAGGVPQSGVSAVVLNVTAADGTLGGFLTAFADNTTRPNASNLNFNPGQAIPNRVIVPVGTDGRVDIYDNVGSVDVIVDVGGWFTDGNGTGPMDARFTPLVPTRIGDTRPGSGQPLAGRTLGPGGTVSVPVASTANTAATLPVGVVAVAGNVTIVNPTDSSFLTVYPDLTTPATASDLDWVPGQVVPNMVVTQLGSNGALGVFNHAGNVDVIVDVFGFWAQ